MKFKINDREWAIKEVEQELFWIDDGDKDKIGKPEYYKEYYFGRCQYGIQEIWLWNKQSKEQKRKTLYHELMHCYRGSYFGFFELDGQSEDFWCDVVANSHDIIHKIVEDYFKEVKKYEDNM